MFNRRNALVGYMVMRMLRSKLRRRRRSSPLADVEWREYASYLDAREHTRAAVSLSLIAGVILGAIAWLATARRH